MPHRPAVVSTPLDPGVLKFRRMVGSEELGRLFEYRLDLLSEEGDVDFDAMLGQNVTVAIALPKDAVRHFNGFVAEFEQSGRIGSYHAYRAVLRPWLWFLTRTGDCRIFQNMTVPEIAKKVFSGHGFTDVDVRLEAKYRKRDYCVQYRETDFDFVSRLFEEEGIYHYCDHADGKHVVVLVDAPHKHEPFAGFEAIEYYPPGSQTTVADHVSQWTVHHSVQTGSFEVDEFDFEQTDADLRKKAKVDRKHALADFGVYDYAAGHTDPKDGEHYAKVRLEERQARSAIVRGQASARGIAVGRTFELAKFPRDDQNVGHIVVGTEIDMKYDEAGESRGAGDVEFSCKFTVIRDTLAYRAASTTPKPIVRGPQTAIVVGKSSEEIWTDEFGRVKVQFHWDRLGKSDENSSCWLRVAQIAAGGQWGAMYLPRVGQEVVVDFLEGDPDRPIVVGRVYNQAAKPPYELPAEATKSTIKTNSSKGGGGFNELRFEDKKDAEQVFLHAQKDLDVFVGNDDKQQIEHDRHVTIGNDRLEKVGGKAHEAIASDLHEQVDGEVHAKVGGARHVEVGAEDHLGIKGDANTKVGGDSSLDTAGSHNQKCGAKLSLDAGSEMHLKAGQNGAFEGGMNLHLKGGMNVVIEAGVGLTLKVGGNFVSLTPAGVDIQGTLVKINTGGAPGSGSGSSPTAPVAPVAPSAPSEPKPPPEVAAGKDVQVKRRSTTAQAAQPGSTKLSAQAQALDDAARDGAPFCEECSKQ